MTLRVVGAGLPRTGTASLGKALEHLLGGRYYHMSVIPGHPFDLGAGWDMALAGETPDWDAIFEGYKIVLDWPASFFWQKLSVAYPDALILLSVRDSAQTWYQSCEATFLPFARLGLAPDWKHGRGLVELLEQFTGTQDWNDGTTLMSAYDRYNDTVRQTAPQARFLEWQAEEGWEPLCQALGVPVPEIEFPWVNRREEWGK